jgi:pimeloyl-ACP methyl ester carboxylesterase
VVGQVGVDGADPAEHVAGAHLVELAGSAHFPWLDQPAEFFIAVKAWSAAQAVGAPA